MPIIKWNDNALAPAYDSWADLDRLFDRQLAAWPGRVSMPAMDVYQDDKNVYVSVEAPGFKQEHIKVTMENNVLTVTAEQRKQSEIDDKAFYRKEIRIGSFQRSVELPATVDADGAQASYKDGMLEITVPKKEHGAPRSIPVR